MPGRKWYVLAALIFLLGNAVFGVFLFLRIRELAEDFQQVVVPGSAEVAVDDPGWWTIYHETGISIDGTYYGASDLTGLRIVVTSPTGRQLDLLPPGMSGSYTIDGRRGVAIFRFDAPQAGTYRLDASYPPGQTGDEGVLSVGTAFAWGIVWTVLGALAIAMASTMLALGIAGVTFVKRCRARRRLSAAPA